MELTKQVCSLELAKKLKELGVKQESLFHWTKDDMGSTYIITSKSLPILHAKCNREPNQSSYDYGWRECVELYSAFSVAELGEMLSKVNSEIFIKAYGDVFHFPGTQHVGLLGVVNLMKTPDMGVMMLIYLLEKKLITL